ncbi:hypothetical protein [Acinetobacter courvalinii]|uniref:hypothetical protein n=1 Tax=Acinetobacter courvalinii TaxID=280147 RepID=UPI0002D10220|nr:hypothetical protein [Acinetobacter courvalinii]ENX05966.1 hypothetical protein F898_02910 [Acinetobacter courvalinii]
MKKLINNLLNSVCHTTTVSSFIKIYESKYIYVHPAPEMLEHEKYGNVNCPNNNTYVRSLNGISLFDFEDFSLEKYDNFFKPGYGDLYRFLPIHERNRKDQISIWLIIDVTLTNKYVNREKLYSQWNSQSKNGKFMPKVEAAILEDIPIAWVKEVFVFKKENNELLKMSLQSAYNYFKNLS